LSSAPPTAIYQLAVSGKILLVISETTLGELRDRTTRKAHLAERIAPQDVDAMESSLRRIATIIPPLAVSLPTRSREPKEDYLLAPEILALVDHIVTGDKDLLDLQGVRENLILSPAAFLRWLDDVPPPTG
jgi:predicted nucleic acid-binding protein